MPAYETEHGSKRLGLGLLGDVQPKSNRLIEPIPQHTRAIVQSLWGTVGGAAVRIESANSEPVKSVMIMKILPLDIHGRDHFPVSGTDVRNLAPR